jgi:hypothetical protein
MMNRVRIRHTVQRVPEEDLAGLETTADLVDPFVVKGHPLGTVGTQSRGLDRIPEGLRVLLPPVRVSKRSKQTQRQETYILAGLRDHRPFMASLHRRMAWL